MELFDYINDASFIKKDVFKDMPEREEKKYPAYLINKYFSFLPDTLFFANELNLRSHIDNKLKHHFYQHSLRKKKRFTKWLKPEEFKELEFIQQVYECSAVKAREYLRLLTPEQIISLKDTYHHLITVKS
jgi:hypothetical protein